MSMVGTFDGFTAARLGIYAAQHGLRVTGNNVSNINTIGYTRQRVDQYSFKVGNNDRYRSFYDNHIGSGALVTGINQIRDPYLDIRYRDASTDTYHYDTWLSGLQNIASILDEVGKGDNEDGLIYKAIQDLAEKLRAYSANPTSLNDRLVRNSAESLTLLFHNAAGRLEKLYNETANEFKEDVSAVNEILLNIRDLNKSIREAEIHGDNALEMRDERNRQIDALSQYLDIRVEYSYEDVGAGIQVEKLTISLNNANPDSTVHTDESVLVDGVYATQLSMPEERPMLNTHGDADGYKYLEGYTYLKKISGDELATFLEDHPELDPNVNPEALLKLVDADGNQILDDAGNPIYLIGTKDSDVDGIVTEKNDNFTIQLGKLLNAKGEEWKSHTTTWADVTSFKTADYNRWTYTVESTLTDADGNNTFIIDDITYTIVANNADASKNQVNLADVQGDKFAAFVANKLKGLDKYKNYTITTEGNQIIFTAKTAGVTPVPGLTVKNNGNGVTVSDPPTNDTITKSIPEDLSAYPQYEYDAHGRVTKSVNYVEVEGKWYKLTIGTGYTHEVTLDDNDLHGILQAERELLTEEGEFSSAKDVAIDESALTKRGIPYYMKSLDLLAQKFAEAYNQLNQGYAFNEKGNYIKEDGTEVTLPDLDCILTDADGNIIGVEEKPVNIDGLTRGQMANLINNDHINNYIFKDKDGYLTDEKGNRITDKDGKPILLADVQPEDYDKIVLDMDKLLTNLNAHSMGGELFTQLDGKTTTGITAKNISISNGWSNGLWNLVPTFKMLFTESGGLTHSTQNDNADHMVAMIDKALVYNPRDLFDSDAIGPELFNGSFNDMLSNMMAVQGEDADITNIRLTTYATALNELDYSREGVSGVDLNDEAMNMVTYQKAMSAAMRVMTAIDEMLDRLINNTGIAGR